jgi:hypothetical protein
MARRLTFEDLPVGACFAFEVASPVATRRKVDTHRTVIIPGGKRPLVVHEIDTPVVTKACPTSFGRRRKRRSTQKRSR